MNFKTKLNPFIMMFFGIIVWAIIALIMVILLERTDSGRGFGFLGSAIYLSPVVCLVVYNVLLLLNRPWRRRNWPLTIFVECALTAWLIYFIMIFKCI